MNSFVLMKPNNSQRSDDSSSLALRVNYGVMVARKSEIGRFEFFKKQVGVEGCYVISKSSCVIAHPGGAIFQSRNMNAQSGSLISQSGNRSGKSGSRIFQSGRVISISGNCVPNSGNVIFISGRDISINGATAAESGHTIPKSWRDIFKSGNPIF